MKRKPTIQTGNNVPMKQAVCVVMGSLLFAFPSCEQSETGNGEKVKVQFSIAAADAWSEENEARSASSKERILETVEIPLDNNWNLRASLVEEPVSPTRVGDNSLEGDKVMVVAYNSSSAPVANVVYTCLSGALTGGSMPLAPGTYTFAAYSCNSSTAPSYNGTNPEPVNPPTDLLWGRSASTVIPSASNVSITLKHLFSLVRYDTDILPAGTATLSDLQAWLTTNYEANLTKLDGTLAKGTASDNELDKVNHQIVYAGGDNSVVVKISGTINPLPSGTPTAFSDVKVSLYATLESGKTYKLLITFHKKTAVRWAGSNIYWDGSQLTFAPAGDTSNEKYQGVCFQFGSLVGVSPAQTNSSNDFDVNNTPIYVPDYGDGTTPGWRKSVADDEGWTWITLPFIFDGSPTNRDNTWVMDAERNTAAMWQACKGDICQYISRTQNLGGDYRLPTSSEFGSSTDYTRSATFGAAPGNAEGTTPITPGYATYTGTVIFPASGSRFYTTGELYRMGNYGYYWSGSVKSAGIAYSLRFYDSEVNSSFEGGYQSGFAVRCVLQ